MSSDTLDQVFTKIDQLSQHFITDSGFFCACIILRLEWQHLDPRNQRGGRCVTPDEIAQYEDIDFDMDEFRNTIGSEAATYATAKDTLMHRWRYPSITIHGVNGADPSPNQTTAIYPKVTGKFSIRTVPTMEGKAVTALVVHYLEQEF
ncbi:hypothetical protein CBS63078_7118 [Aspergillus niger]|nr:hypothetical protein CBS63078_7118 [Aspergillus niger]